MIYFFQNNDLIVVWLYIFIMFFLRYLLFASVGYFVFWKWKKGYFQEIRIQKDIPDSSNFIRDFYFSLLACGIFAGAGLLISIASRNGYTRLYFGLNDYPLWYFMASLIVLVLTHDTWFYWIHRFMHLPVVYQKVHRIHHLSTNPSPWTAFAFHPLETVLEAMILPLVVLVFPVHIYAIVIFLVIMTAMNVVGHLGYEIYPAGFLGNKLGRWNHVSTHHNMHHQYSRYNYGLYFNFWDTIMKTNHPHYFKRFGEIKSGTSGENI